MATRGSYPHPVLDDASDDIDARFTMANAKVGHYTDHIEVSFTLEMGEPTLVEMIESGEARLSAHVRCAATFLTQESELVPRAGNYHRGTFVVSVPQEDVHGDVQLSVKVIATAASSGYRPSRQNPDYGEATFEILKGDVLADAGVITFVPGKSYDPMNPPLESCFVFKAVPTQRGGIAVDTSGDHVEILFAPETFALFDGERSRPDVQVAMVVLPVLVEVLSTMKVSRDSGGQDDNASSAWHRALTNSLERLGITEKSPLEQAQRILDGNPIGSALSALDREEEE